jgi:hypothetical protein
LIFAGVASEEEKRARALIPSETSAGTLEGGVEDIFRMTVVLLVFLAITSNLVFAPFICVPEFLFGLNITTASNTLSTLLGRH